MLAGARRTLLTRPSPIVVPAFLWKLMSAEGLRPQLEVCASCGEEIRLDQDHDERTRLSFDIGLGGVLCRSCGSMSGVGISLGARNLMRRILGGNLNEVLDEVFDPQGQRLDDPMVNEVSAIATSAFEHHMERRLRSVRIFERE
jgi:recombinational DNA repair protein (RecF pathway)